MLFGYGTNFLGFRSRSLAAKLAIGLLVSLVFSPVLVYLTAKVS